MTHFLRIKLAIFLLYIVFSGHCQSQTLSRTREVKKLHHYASLNFGLNSFYRGIPYGVTYEYGKGHFSAGILLDMNLGSYESNFVMAEGRWKYKASYYGLRGSYHFDKIFKSDKVDFYAGAGAGYQNFVWRDIRGKGYTFKRGASVDYFLGGKVRLRDALYLCLEGGNIGMSNVRVGVSVKIEER